MYYRFFLLKKLTMFGVGRALDKKLSIPPKTAENHIKRFTVRGFIIHYAHDKYKKNLKFDTFKKQLCWVALFFLTQVVKMNYFFLYSFYRFILCFLVFYLCCE